ncbi:hypothetical protein Hanom_Chr04g00303951 [Helianthus anomalus]
MGHIWPLYNPYDHFVLLSYITNCMMSYTQYDVKSSTSVSATSYGPYSHLNTLFKLDLYDPYDHFYSLIQHV